MTNLEKIQSAEEAVAGMQDVLASVQLGLERAEEVAIAAEEAKRRSEQVLKVTLGLIALSLLLIVLSRRKPRA